MCACGEGKLNTRRGVTHHASSLMRRNSNVRKRSWLSDASAMRGNTATDGGRWSSVSDKCESCGEREKTHARGGGAGNEAASRTGASPKLGEGSPGFSVKFVVGVIEEHGGLMVTFLVFEVDPQVAVIRAFPGALLKVAFNTAPVN